MFEGLHSIEPEGTPSELDNRLYDMELRIPKLPSPNSNDVPMALLPNNADLAQVIKAINELIKRDLTTKRVE